MTRSRWSLALLALAICGCGSSAIPAIPTPHPSPNPRQSNARVVAQADPRLDAVVGRLQAVDLLISQADTLVAAAIAAQASQLSDSANRDLIDARNSLDGAHLVLRLVGDPSRFRRAATLLGGALNWYGPALAAGLRDENRAQDDANRGHMLLLQADALLTKSPEAGLLQTIAAKTAAMDLASRFIASRTKRAAKKKVSRPPAPRVIAYRPRPTATPQPTVTPIPSAAPVPTATATFKRVVPARATLNRAPTKQHARKGVSATAAPHPPTPTPTASPARAPTSSGTARPTRVAAGPAHPVRSTAQPRVTPAFESAFADVAHATGRIRQCSAYLLSLGTGSDPLGSIKIIQCVDRARHRLERLLRRLAPNAQQQSPAAVKVAVAIAYANVLKSKHELQRAKQDVEAGRLDQAQMALAAAATHVQAAHGALVQARRSIGTR